MATASDIIKARRRAKEETSHVIEQTPAEKLEAIDNLFKSLPTSVPEVTPAPPRKEVKESVSGVEIYSTFGGGEILIRNKSTSLPCVISDPLILMELRSQYAIDAPHSVLRSRRIK